MKKTKVFLLILLCCAFLTAGGGILVYYIASGGSSTVGGSGTAAGEMASVETPAPTPTPVPTPTPEPTPTPFPERDITLMAVGDDLLHMGIVKTGTQEDGSLNYDFLFESISDMLENADVKIINQETILGGNDRGFSGFPRFNSPTEVGDAIAAAGFNVVLQASNHSADQGVDGLLSCAAFWKTHPEVLVTGIYETEEDAEELPLITIDDVTFAVLNYTYSPNSETIPSSVVGHLNFLCSYNERNRLDFTTLNPQVLSDIERAKEAADIVIVCPHWGTEYSTKPSKYQKEFAMQMAEAGADLIIGTHPHVIQPVEWIEAENGNRALCFYSLGNYVSTQKNAQSMLEAMAWVTFHVAEDGISITSEKTGAIPMVCQYNNRVRFENVYFLENYTAELAASHGIRSYGGVTLSLDDLTKWSNEILGEWMLTKEQALSQ